MIIQVYGSSKMPEESWPQVRLLAGEVWGGGEGAGTEAQEMAQWSLTYRV